jgi:hypothetical protein
MADKKISDFTSKAVPDDDDLLELETAAGNSRKCTVAQLGDALGGGYEASSPSVPLVSTFTWANQGTSTATDGTDAIIMSPQPNSIVRSLYKTAPSYPYDVYMRVEVTWLATAGTTVIGGQSAILLRDAGDGEQLGWTIGANRPTGDEQTQWFVEMQRINSTGTVTAGVLGRFLPDAPKWIRVNVTSTTVTCYYSLDGKNWITVGTEALSSYIDNADQYGIATYATANAVEYISNVSYFDTVAP